MTRFSMITPDCQYLIKFQPALVEKYLPDSVLKSDQKSGCVQCNRNTYGVSFRNLPKSFCTFNIVIDRLTAHSKLFCNLSQAVVICVVELDVVHLACPSRALHKTQRAHSFGWFSQFPYLSLYQKAR